MSTDWVPVESLESSSLDVEHAVRHRYSSASKTVEPSLCCPVKYDPEFLEFLPQELIDRDYGCGDPSRWIRHGETVLDVGSGGGKICYIASQIVGSEGRVLGVDMNDDMLELAEKYRESIGDRIGYHNVQFFKGRIQDLALDLRVFEQHLTQKPVSTASEWMTAQSFADDLRRKQPMIADNSVDVVVSNCVLNLVDPAVRHQLFSELFRVVRPGGRVVISDIVCDEPVPESMRNDATLWSGCISGAYVERDFLNAFARAGFYGIELVDRPEQPWATIEGIEFRSVTICAYKGKQWACIDENQAVIYRGPWKEVVDDDGHTLRRGEPVAVCEKTFDIYCKSPYADQIVPVPPRVKPTQGRPFDCNGRLRDPRETKGADFFETKMPQINCCGGSGEC